MSKTYRVGIIGFAHMHINSVGKLFADQGQCKVVGIADVPLDHPETPEASQSPYTRGWNIQFAKDHFGEGIVEYPSYLELLDKAQLDIAVVTTENKHHRAIAIECLKRGIAVSLEKPVSMNLRDALAIYRAQLATGTPALVNWSVAVSPQSHEIKRLIDSGVIGDIFEMRLRSGHNGPLGEGAKHPGVTRTAEPMAGTVKAQTWWHQSAMGGGAMLDFCGYGCIMSRWFMKDKAVAAMGMRGNFLSQYGDADDNATMLVRYPNAMAVLSATWSTMYPGVPNGPVIYGSKGTIVQESDGGITVYKNSGETEKIQPKPLPENRNTVAKALVNHLETGEALYEPYQLGFNVDMMAILEAGIKSADSGKIELVDSAVWAIG